MQVHLSLRRILGFFVTLTSAFLMMSAIPIVITPNAVIMWLTIWLSAVGIFIGCYLMSELPFRKFLKPLFIGILSLLIMNIIFLTPFGIEFQLLLINLFLLIVLSLSRYYSRRKSQKRELNK